jgi:N6-adenosine-specific RNA methylase IME4
MKKRSAKPTPRKRELTNRRAALKRKAKSPSTKIPSPFPRQASANKPSDWVAGEDYNARAEQPSWPPNKIKVGERYRINLGDIKSLAADINERGLLHPIVVDLKCNLIAGERRLAAWKISNFRGQAIPIHTVPLTDLVSGEWAENDPRLRQDFTPSETVEIKRAIESKLKPAAQLRIAHGGTAPGRGAKASISEQGSGDRAAAFTGKSRRTVEKAEKVVDAARENPERFGKLKDDMDRTGRVHGPFKRLERMRQGDEIRKAPPPLPMKGPYGGLVIDFPWPNEPNASQEDIDARGRSLRPYPAMSIKAGCRFLKEKVKPLLDKNAVIGMWTTNYHMPYAFQLLEALGFPIGTHSTIETWVKDKMGRGQVRRDKTEHCILALKGKPVVTLTNETTELQAPWSGNSHKPNEFYEKFERTFPARRYAEVFSMGGRGENWDCHGDQVGKFAPAVARSAEAALLKEAAENGAVLDAISQDEELKILEVASAGQTAWSSKLADQLKKKGLIAGDQKWRMTSKGRVRLADLRRKARATAKTSEEAVAA